MHPVKTVRRKTCFCLCFGLPLSTFYFLPLERQPLITNGSIPINYTDRNLTNCKQKVSCNACNTIIIELGVDDPDAPYAGLDL